MLFLQPVALADPSTRLLENYHQHWSHWLGSPSAGSIVEPRPPGSRDIKLVAAVPKKAGKVQAGGDNFSMIPIIASYDQSSRCVVVRPPLGHTPHNKAICH